MAEVKLGCKCKGCLRGVSREGDAVCMIMFAQADITVHKEDFYPTCYDCVKSIDFSEHRSDYATKVFYPKKVEV